MNFNDQEEIDWICKHFDNMMQMSSQDEKKKYIFNHPVLLSANATNLLNAVLGNLPKIQSEIEYLTHLKTHYWSHKDEYPTGFGPIEKVVVRLRDGEIGFEEARQLVKETKCTGLLSPLYVKVYMYQLFDEIEIDAGFAMKCADLVVESAMAHPLRRLSTNILMQASEGYIMMAHRSQMKRPDGKVFSKAIRSGQWAAKVAVESNRNTLMGEFLHMIGTLALDAYGGNFAPGPNYKTNIDIHIQRAISPMPSPEEGLKMADLYLDLAIPQRTAGSAKGLTIKAQIESLIYLSTYTGEQVDLIKLKALEKTALDNLNPETDSLHIQRIKNLSQYWSN